MHIRFFATIRRCTGVAELRWDEPTATVGELLKALSDRYGPEFRRWVLDGDDLGKVVLVVINGHDARHHGGIDARLQADDTVAIFPSIAGGRTGLIES